jgi:glycosyltransferase involved in cell wall biosynthesis
MRVLFYLADQHPWRDRSIGITGYTDGLIRGLQARSDVEIGALVSRSSYRPPVPARLHRIPLDTDRRATRLLVDQLAPLVPASPDLWHFPKGFLPLALRPRQPTVGTVHDTIVMHYATHYPQTRSRAEFAYWRQVLRRSLSRFDLVLTVSRTSREQILAFCDDARITAPRIEVTYEGARFEQEAGGTPDKDDYVVHLGSPAPHKRTATLLSHWGTLQERGRDLPRLVIVGALDGEAATLAAQLRGIELQPRADETALKALLSGARALLLPSEIEGFGLPALEAYYLGTPVVFVRGTSVHEVLGDDAPGAFELDDATGLDSALEAALALDADAVAQRALALRERFSWSSCVERTTKAYEALLRV